MSPRGARVTPLDSRPALGQPFGMQRILIIGGGIVGTAIAFFLAEAGGAEITVLERDPTHARASTALSASGLRQQFSTPLNIALSRFGAEFLRTFPENLHFRENGYLFLAATEAQEARMRHAHAIQREAGAEVALLDPDRLAARFPHLRVDDLRLASLGLSSEGWFDNMGLLGALRRRARDAGARFLTAEVSALRVSGARVTAARLTSGEEILCDVAVNAAGPRSAEIARMAGLALPVEPRKRTVFTFACARPPEGALPLTVDPTGVYVRPEGSLFLCGAPPVEDPAVAHDDFEPRHEEFEEIVWPALAARSPAFEAIRPGRFWAGHYEWCTLDRNGIAGPHPDLPNLVFATGFSGHGLQHAPGIGRGVAELILEGGCRSLDLSPLGWERILSGRPLRETEVI